MRFSTDLDGTDLAILSVLQRDGRVALGSLAEQVGLSGPAVAERVRKLEERGVIRGFMASVDPERLGLDIAAFIQVRVDSSATYPAFIAAAAKHPEVLECHAITGEASHLLKIRTHNTASLETLLGEIQRWPGVVSTRTNLVLSSHKETVALPDSYAADIVASDRAGRRRGSAQATAGATANGTTRKAKNTRS